MFKNTNTCTIILIRGDKYMDSILNDLLDLSIEELSILIDIITDIEKSIIVQ